MTRSQRIAFAAAFLAVAAIIAFTVWSRSTGDDVKADPGVSLGNTAASATSATASVPPPAERTIADDPDHASENAALCLAIDTYGGVIFAALAPFGPEGSDVNASNTTAVLFPAGATYRSAVESWVAAYGDGAKDSELYSPAVQIHAKTITWETPPLNGPSAVVDVPGAPLVPRTDGVIGLLYDLRYVCEQQGNPTPNIPDPPNGRGTGGGYGDGDVGHDMEGDDTASPTG